MQESEAAGLGFRPFGGAGLEQWVDVQHEALVSSCDELEVLGTETRKSEQVEMRQRVARAGRLFFLHMLGIFEPQFPHL